MAISKEGRIYKNERINGELYRVMYYKGSDGKYKRSKYPKKINEKKAKPMKKTKSKPKPQPQQQVRQQPPMQPTTTQPQNSDVPIAQRRPQPIRERPAIIDDYGPQRLGQTSRKMAMEAGRFTPKSGATSNLINEYASLGRRRRF